MEKVKQIQRSDEGKVDHAYLALRTTFILVPILAGLDKFSNILTDWTKYLAPAFTNFLNLSPSTFMMGVGIIEIVAGIGVMLKPRVFSYVVSAWMVGIALNLVILGQYYDVAVRDLALAVGAYALGQLSVHHEQTEGKSLIVGHRRENLSYQ